MANGTLLICGNIPFQSVRFSVRNFKLRPCSIIKGDAHLHPVCHLEPIMAMNSSERSGSTGKKSVVSRESKEVYRSPDDQLPVMRLFRKLVTGAGVLVECTHRGCKPVFEEDDTKCNVPHEWPSFENIMNENLQDEYAIYGWKFGRGDLAEKGIELKVIEPIMEQTGEKEVVNVVGMYASFLWATEESHD